ncbi:MAG: hypothetical protein ACFFE8_02495 [Candidatus Heimdallarchaeota archaeon]
MCPTSNIQENNDGIPGKLFLLKENNGVVKPKISSKEKADAERIAQLMERVILLLSFKDAPQQNLPEILDALDIKTLEDKTRVLQEIYRLIREGIVYVPSGLPELIRQGLSPTEMFQDKVLIRLLRPYDKIISEILRELTVYQERLNLK